MKFDILAESTCEAELIATNTGAHDAIWLGQLVDELKLPRTGILLYCDSSTDETRRKAPSHQAKDLKIREYVSKNGMTAKPVATTDSVADMLTKPLNVEPLRHHRARLGVCAIE
ncbi:hypothetical protein GN244_ATG15596 [Phytophthora infestans]|uniref:Uncharacterized protein n=1 Tax=Phytophthora infestans TaxID=4787 RepID=A0A833SJ31_PHYIN|nr:hypothetical protein GN244_ATG15596 [Phytophthora infestans]